jgi:hypothetical protein
VQKQDSWEVRLGGRASYRGTMQQQLLECSVAKDGLLEMQEEVH